MRQCHRPWESRERCADHTTGAHAYVPVFEEIVEVTQFIPHERIAVVFPVPQIQEPILEVAKNIPQDRVSSNAEQIVVCQNHRSCRKCGGDTAWCVAVEQIVAFPMPQIIGES